MASLVKRTVDWLIQSEIIKAEDSEIYSFGLRQSLIYLLNILTFLAIALSFGMFWSVGVFLIVYLALRQYAGGYHAETEFGCYISSTSIITIAAYLLKRYSFSFEAIIVILAISCIAILILGPVEDHNKPLDDLEVKVYGKRMRLILVGELILIVISALLNYNFVIEAATLGLAVLGLIVILGWLKNRFRAIGT